MTDEEFKLNDSGYLIKNGHNIIYHQSKEIAQMGIGEVKDGKMNMIDFMSLEEGKGYGKASIKFLFNQLSKINVIELKCKDHVLSFWQKCGGVVTDKDTYYNTVTISRK